MSVSVSNLASLPFGRLWRIIKSFSRYCLGVTKRRDIREDL